MDVTPRGLIAFDLDGTVYAGHEQQALSERVRRAFIAAHDAGWKRAVAPGRARPELGVGLARAPWLDGHITSSGAVVARAADPAPAAEHFLAHDLACEVKRLLGDAPLHFWAQASAGFFCEGYQRRGGISWMPPHAHLVPDILDIPDAGKGYYKLMVHFAHESERLAAERMLAPLAGALEMANEGPVSLELTARGVGKGAGALEVCAAEGLDSAASIAFGDSGNDLTFAETPLTFVVMASAERKVLDAADAVCPDALHDGVAVWLEEHVL